MIVKGTEIGEWELCININKLECKLSRNGRRSSSCRVLI